MEPSGSSRIFGETSSCGCLRIMKKLLVLLGALRSLGELCALKAVTEKLASFLWDYNNLFFLKN